MWGCRVRPESLVAMGWAIEHYHNEGGWADFSQAFTVMPQPYGVHAGVYGCEVGWLLRKPQGAYGWRGAIR